MTDIILRNGSCFLAMDEAMGGFPTPLAAFNAARLLGMDESSNRSLTRDGAMHVKSSNISKSNICKYSGHEIPGWQRLGLDPHKKYKLLRDPDELKKAAPTFNNLPILARHVPVTAEDHQPHLIIGTTGTDATYSHPHLKNSTAFWSGGAVNAINSEAMKELSSAYHYDPDMTPGEYEGEAYDGVMRNIVGNHVALVREGRAGDDVVVGDSKPEEYLMSKAVLSRTALYAAGAVSALIASKLAMDEKPIDTSAMFEGVTSKNFTQMLPEVSKRARTALKGIKLAQDASIEDVVKLVDALEQPEVAEGADADPETGAPLDADALKAALMDPGAADIDVDAKRKEFLSGKLSAEDMKAFDAIGGAAVPEVKPEVNKVDEEMKIDKPAMDEAIKSALSVQSATFKATRAAELAVQPWVGSLPMAFDSAEQVHRKTLDVLGIAHQGKHPDALMSIIEAQPKPGARPAPKQLAMDGAPPKDFGSRFPGADNIGQA